jgi:excisionase family DNA binding protein
VTGTATATKRPTAALFVRIPAEQARRLDRAAFELRRSKQALVSELVERYVDPDSPASLRALGAITPARERARGGQAAQAQTGLHGEAGRRRVTVETLEPDTPVVGHHSFRPEETQPALAPAESEVLNSEQAAELLQLAPSVVEQLAEDGELPGRRLAGNWRFSREALLGALAQTAPAGERGTDDDDR